MRHNSTISQANHVCAWQSVATAIEATSVSNTPGDSTNTRGVDEELSLKHAAKSKGGGSMNLWPRFSVTKSRKAASTLSGRKHRSTSSFWKRVMVLSNGSARGNSCACSRQERKQHSVPVSARGFVQQLPPPPLCCAEATPCTPDCPPDISKSCNHPNQLAPHLIAVKYGFVVLEVAGHVLVQAMVGRQVSQAQQLAPRLLCQPIWGGVIKPHALGPCRGRALLAGGASQQEAPFLGVYAAGMLQSLDGQHKAEQQLVPLKQAAAHVDVQAVREVVVQQLPALYNG